VGIARCCPAGDAYADVIDASDDVLTVDVCLASGLGVVVTGPGVDGAT